jgi:hypothetical protein
MPLPSDIDTVTVTGQYLRLDGDPARGRVHFAPTMGPITVHTDTSQFVLPSMFSVTLDATGAFTIDLPAGDSPALDPTGFQYAVRDDVDDLRRSFLIDAPTGSPTIDLTQVAPAAPTLPVSEQFDADARYGRLAADNAWSGNQTLESSFDGGDDTSDSTSRINLESYQSSPINAWGEVIRIFLRKAKAKAMAVWYFPQGGYDASHNPVGNFKPTVWTGAHWRSGDGATLHKHWSIETPDSTGALQTRFEVVFGDQSVDNAISGLDKTRILTNLADFVVRCSNGQVLRLSTALANEKAIEFANDAEGVVRQWKLRSTATQGDFQLVRYDDAGTFVDAFVTIKRGTGRVGIGTIDPTTVLDVNSDKIRVRTAKTPASASATGTQGDIAWDTNFLYVCVATDTWKRVAIASW